MGRAAGRVLLINQYYAPDMAATAQLLADLGEHLAGSGRCVRAIASRGRYMPREGAPLPRRALIDGVTVERLSATNLGRGRRLYRIADYLSFLASLLWRMLRVRRGDTVVVLSTPPLVAIAGVLARRRGAHMVYKVEDLYPDVALQLGVLRPGIVSRLTARVSRFVIGRADRLVVLDEGMQHAICERGATPDRVHVIPNWADERGIHPMPASQSRLRQSLALPSDMLVVGYSGNLGLAHQFDSLAEAIESLAQQAAPVHFLITGAGARLAPLQALAERVSNLTILPYQPRAALGDTLAASDVQIVSLRPEVEGLLYPSKFAGMLAAGRPVLGLVEPASALGREIQDARVGWAVGSDTNALLQVIADAQSLDARMKRGDRARAHFEDRYRRDHALRAWTELLATVER